MKGQGQDFEGEPAAEAAGVECRQEAEEEELKEVRRGQEAFSGDERYFTPLAWTVFVVGEVPF